MKREALQKQLNMLDSKEKSKQYQEIEQRANLEKSNLNNYYHNYNERQKKEFRERRQNDFIDSKDYERNLLENSLRIQQRADQEYQRMRQNQRDVVTDEYRKYLERKQDMKRDRIAEQRQDLELLINKEREMFRNEEGYKDYMKRLNDRIYNRILLQDHFFNGKSNEAINSKDPFVPKSDSYYNLKIAENRHQGHGLVRKIKFRTGLLIKTTTGYYPLTTT